jgi:nucleoid-associated protein YgaU
MSRKEYREEREENLNEYEEETEEVAVEKPDSTPSKSKSSRLGKEAKIGAAVILLLFAVFIAAVAVRLFRSHSTGTSVVGVEVAKGKTPLANKENVKTPIALAPQRSYPAATNTTMKIPPTIVPTKTAPVAPPLFPDPLKPSPSERAAGRSSEPPLGLGRTGDFFPPAMNENRNVGRGAASPPRDTAAKASADSGFASAGDVAPPLNNNRSAVRNVPPPSLNENRSARRDGPPPSLNENRSVGRGDPLPPLNENRNVGRGAAPPPRDTTAKASADGGFASAGDDGLPPMPTLQPEKARRTNEDRGNTQRPVDPSPYNSRFSSNNESGTKANSARTYPPNSDGDAEFKRPTQPMSSVPPTDRASMVGGRSYRVERKYRVKEGDTLFTIARYELGRASRWVDVYNRNRDMLGDDFNNLKPGMMLLLPDAENPDRVAEPPRGTYRG